MMDNHELAVLMAQGAGNRDRSKTGQYYMLNLGHPVIASLRRRFCQNRGIPVHDISWCPNFGTADTSHSLLRNTNEAKQH